MDNWDYKSDNGEESKLRVDFLNRFEIYSIMVNVFFKKLSKEDQIDALIEIAEILKSEQREVNE